MKKETLTYNVIVHPIRKKLELSLLQYCVADSIYHLSNNPNSKIKGWCYASKTTIADLMGVSERCVFSNLKVLVEKNLIEKNEDSSYLRTTSKWYENVVLVRAKKEYEEVSGGMKKVHSGYEESAVKHTAQISYNSNNKDSNINNKEEAKQVLQEPLSDLIEAFKEINPSYKKLFNTTQRGALQRLVEQHGAEKVSQFIEVLPETNKMKYAPVIVTPLQLENKLASLLVFIQKEKIDRKPNIAVI